MDQSPLSSLCSSLSRISCIERSVAMDQSDCRLYPSDCRIVPSTVLYTKLFRTDPWLFKQLCEDPSYQQSQNLTRKSKCYRSKCYRSKCYREADYRPRPHVRGTPPRPLKNAKITNNTVHNSKALRLLIVQVRLGRKTKMMPTISKASVKW